MAHRISEVVAALYVACLATACSSSSTGTAPTTTADGNQRTTSASGSGGASVSAGGSGGTGGIGSTGGSGGAGIGGGGGTGGSTNVPGCLAAPAGMVAWWRADGNTLDSVGGNHGTPVGNVSYKKGVVGQAIHFSGNDYMTAPTASLPVGGADRTVEAWVEFEAPYEAGSLEGLFFGYGSWGTTGGSFSLLVADNGSGTWKNSLTFTQWGAGVFQHTPAEQGVWYHFAAVLSGGTETVYVNGEVVDTGAFPVSTPPGSTAYFGGYPNPPANQPTEWLVGGVDELSVYSRGLQGAEIAQIYATGAAGKCH